MIVPKQILREWIQDALRAHGGAATLIQVCRHIWQHHEDDLGDHQQPHRDRVAAGEDRGDRGDGHDRDPPVGAVHAGAGDPHP